jgi:cytochrome P450
MSPPIPATLWRTQVQDEDKPLIIDGQVIPKGTEIGINTYAFHHNEDIFPDPFCFKPERWLERSSNEKHEIQRREFAVFSIGARGCPGKAIAYLEISLVIAKTLWHFDFETGLAVVDNTWTRSSSMGNAGFKIKETQFQVQDRFTSAHNGPYLLFHPRKRATVDE